MRSCEGLREHSRTVLTRTGPGLKTGLFSRIMVRSTVQVGSMVLVWALLGSLVSVKGTLMEDQEELLVELHNRYRGVVQPSASAMLPLKWDGNLKLVAEGYAAKCIWNHNPDLEDTGENLFAGTGDLDLERAVEKWFLERLDYNYDNNSCDEDKMCGHYTQMVWADTHRVGCAVHLCAQMEGLDWTEPSHFLVCNYYPPGNYEGERPYVEGEWCSQCPENLQRCENNLCAPEVQPTVADEAADSVTDSALDNTPGTDPAPDPDSNSDQESDQDTDQDTDQDLKETVEQEAEAVVPPPATESIPPELLSTAEQGTEEIVTTAETIEETEAETIEETEAETIEETEAETIEETEAETIEETETETILETEPMTIEDTKAETIEETEPEPIEETVPETVEETVPKTLPEIVQAVIPDTLLETFTVSVLEVIPESVQESVTETVAETELRTEPEVELQPKPKMPKNDPMESPARGVVHSTEQEVKTPPLLPIGEKAPPRVHLTPPPENRGQKQKDISVDKHKRDESRTSGSGVLFGSWSVVFLWICLLWL